MSLPILDLAGNKSVMTLGRKIAKLSEFCHDYSAGVAQVGQVVKMPIIGATAGVFDASTNNYEQSSTIDEATCVLSNHFVAGFSVDPIKMSDGLGAYANFWDNCGEQSGKAIARAIEDAVVGQVESSLSGEFDETLTLNRAGFTGLWNTCYKHEIDPSNAVVVLNPSTYAKLLDVMGGDYRIGNPNDNPVATGYIDNFLGFARIICSQSVDADLLGFVAEKGSIALCSRKLPLLDQYPIYGEYTDADTGVSITMLGFQKFATGDTFITATSLFGTSIVADDKIIRLVSAS